MFGFTFLQILLIINVFIMGSLVTIAVRHAYAHFRPEAHEPEKPHQSVQPVRLPADVKERLLKVAQANFQTILDRSAAELQRDLKTTTSQLNKHLEKLGTDIISDEMNRYHNDLEQLRKQAENTIVSAQSDITEHQTELKAKLAERQTELEAQLVENMKAEQQQITKDIDTKLADAMASFLLETLQHNIDLGAQGTYLIATLEDHKTEFNKAINE